MKKIKVSDEVFINLSKGIKNRVVLKKEKLKNGEKIILENEITKQTMPAQITAVNLFSKVEDIFKVIPYEIFCENELKKKIEEGHNHRDSEVIVYRIKVDIKNDIEKFIKDKNIYEILDMTNIEEINLGRSTSRVFKSKIKANPKIAILKTQNLPNRTSLKDEYERLKWLDNKINCPKVYYWNEIDGYEYLIMEFKEGLPAFKFDDIGYRLGNELKKIHSINIENCKFYNNAIDTLLNNCIKRIDSIIPEIRKKYPNEDKESILKFITENKPQDKVLVHGDYSLPNILIDNSGKYTFIDLGDISISSKYYDFYYFIRSLKINKKLQLMPEFLKGYGIERLNENYLKWMDIIDKSLY